MIDFVIFIVVLIVGLLGWATISVFLYHYFNNTILRSHRDEYLEENTAALVAAVLWPVCPIIFLVLWGIRGLVALNKLQANKYK